VPEQLVVGAPHPLILRHRDDEQALRTIDKQKRDFAHRLFQCLVVSKRPVRVEELAELFSIRLDAESIPTFKPHWRPLDPEEAVLSACSSLVTVVNVNGKSVPTTVPEASPEAVAKPAPPLELIT